jgi:hypothetical protein
MNLSCAVNAIKHLKMNFNTWNIIKKNINPKIAENFPLVIS